MEKHHRLLGIPLLIFLICFLLVGYNNRFASDDFEFLNKLREFGYTGSVKWFHEHWNTRWAAIGLLNGVLLFTLKSGSLVWYHLTSLLLLWWAVYRNLRNLISQGRTLDMIFSGYGTAAFFFACFSISDVFFWINTSTMYLYGCIALLFAIGEITTKKHTICSYLRLAGFGLLLAGTYEPLVFTCMVCCLFILVVLVNRHQWNVWRIPVDKKVIIFLSSLMLGFAISYAGEGHAVRSAQLPQTEFVFKLWVWIKAIVKMFGIYIPGKLTPVLLLSFPWFISGMINSYSWLTAAFLKKSTVVFLLLVLISLFPVAFIMSEMGPERAWTQVSLYLTIYSALLAFYAGKLLRHKYSRQNVTVIYTGITSLYLLATGLTMVVQAKKYSEAYDSRIAVLLNFRENGNRKQVALEPLPPSGWLHSAELSDDPGHFNNWFIKEFLDLEFDVIVK